MTADPAEPIPNTVEIGGKQAVVIPLLEYRMLKALAARAAPDEIEAARAAAEYLADKEGMRARGVRLDDLDAAIGALDTADA